MIDFLHKLRHGRHILWTMDDSNGKDMTIRAGLYMRCGRALMEYNK